MLSRRPPAVQRTSSRSGGLRGSLCDIGCKASGELCPRRFGLLQPVRHPHPAVHRRRGGEVLVALLTLARTPIELPEAEVAVGDERPHAARLGEGQRLGVVGFSTLTIELIWM